MIRARLIVWLFAALAVVNGAHGTDPLRELKHERKPDRVAYSPDGKLLAVAANDGYTEYRKDGKVAGEVVLWYPFAQPRS